MFLFIVLKTKPAEPPIRRNDSTLLLLSLRAIREVNMRREE
jgi:hypothetical protein